MPFLEYDNAIAALRSLESVVSIPRGMKCMDHLPSHVANGVAGFYKHQKSFWVSFHRERHSKG